MKETYALASIYLRQQSTVSEDLRILRWVGLKCRIPLTASLLEVWDWGKALLQLAMSLAASVMRLKQALQAQQRCCSSCSSQIAGTAVWLPYAQHLGHVPKVDKLDYGISDNVKVETPSKTRPIFSCP